MKAIGEDNAVGNKPLRILWSDRGVQVRWSWTGNFRLELCRPQMADQGLLESLDPCRTCGRLARMVSDDTHW